MEHFKRKFNTPVDAQTFLKSVHERINDPCLLMEFTAACVETQAAMADWLIKEAHFIDVQRNKYFGGNFKEKNSQLEIEAAWDDYNRASLEFQLAKIKMQKIINRLFMTDIQRQVSTDIALERTHLNSLPPLSVERH